MYEMTIPELQKKMDSGEYTARSITERYLDRIEEIDKRGPKLNAVIELNPDALDIADSLDKERREKGSRGPLHGIPVILKDNINTGDRMMTTAGSLALEGSYAPRDSFVAQKLREAGAIILGKANLSEFANARGTNSIGGWSSRGGLTLNPYALDRNTIGSSSGSAAAVAADLCSVAVGTETDGSIVCPASACSLVGIKPTVGLVSRSGIIPISYSQDTAGPMARTVTDAAILLGAMTGPDTHDAMTESSEGNYHTDYTPFLDPDGLKGSRIGVARSLFSSDTRVNTLINGCVDEMKRLGAEIIELKKPFRTSMTNQRLHRMLTKKFIYEFKTGVESYLAELGDNTVVHSLKEIIEFNEKNKEKTMPYFGQELLLNAEKQKPLTPEEYASITEELQRAVGEKGIDAFISKYGLDAIVSPTAGPPGLNDFIAAAYTRIGGSPTPAAMSGYPHITVPAGYLYGLPVGISFIAGAYREPKLIKLAYAFEQATRVRKPPQFLPTARLDA
ncbi:MAG: amidase [Dehalococcoidales bacterium]|nr:amidase [Dehalococcoidales bacterium]